MKPDELRALLQLLGVGTTEAARLVHVEARSMRRWLAGERDVTPSAAQLLRLAAALPAARAWLEQHRLPGED